ncbi:hypothetical protein GJ496_000237 [Pomphorhynchus laevis]|nr:hypothetical protein GJ496_000237 [Pomphorhynchus laevis]
MNSSLNLDKPHVDACATLDMLISAIVLNEIDTTETVTNSLYSNELNMEIIPGINQNEELAVPHVSIQLDILNQRNEAINKLEVEYEDQLRTYTSMVHESNTELNKIEKKLGDCVRTAFSYYNALDDLFAAKANHTKYIERFEKIQSNLRHIHDFIEHFDHSSAIYDISDFWIKLADRATEMAINNARFSLLPFYDRRYALRKKIKTQEALLFDMKTCVMEAKSEYTNALRRLEMISNEIHKHRTNSTVIDSDM